MKVIFYTLLVCGVITALADDTKTFFRKSKFPLDMYRELIKSNYGNLMVSPLSMEIVLALLQNGGDGPASDEIVKALELPENSYDTKEIFREVTSSLEHYDNYNLSSANKLYLSNDYAFYIFGEFEQVSIGVFDTQIENIDFSDSAGAVVEINDWVREKTHDQIKQIFQNSEVTSSTKMVLVNALFFQGNWLNAFPDKDTKKDRFFVDEKDYVETTIMEVSGEFNYFEISELKAKMLEMFYVGDDISMTIVLPDDREGLSALENAFTESWFFMEYEKPTYVHVRLPKFKIETEINFVSILKGLGINAAFDEGFNKIVYFQDIPLSQIKQKTFLDVDEKGTTAAAASITQNILSPYHNESSTMEFFAQHPFLFYIRSYKLGTVLFMGRVTSPKHD